MMGPGGRRRRFRRSADIRAGVGRFLVGPSEKLSNLITFQRVRHEECGRQNGWWACAAGVAVDPLVSCAPRHPAALEADGHATPRRSRQCR